MLARIPSRFPGCLADGCRQNPVDEPVRIEAGHRSDHSTVLRCQPSLGVVGGFRADDLLDDRQPEIGFRRAALPVRRDLHLDVVPCVSHLRLPRPRPRPGTAAAAAEGAIAVPTMTLPNRTSRATNSPAPEGHFNRLRPEHATQYCRERTTVSKGK